MPENKHTIDVWLARRRELDALTHQYIADFLKICDGNADLLRYNFVDVIVPYVYDYYNTVCNDSGLMEPFSLECAFTRAVLTHKIQNWGTVLLEIIERGDYNGGDNDVRFENFKVKYQKTKQYKIVSTRPLEMKDVEGERKVVTFDVIDFASFLIFKGKVEVKFNPDRPSEIDCVNFYVPKSKDNPNGWVFGFEYKSDGSVVPSYDQGIGLLLKHLPYFDHFYFLTSKINEQSTND